MNDEISILLAFHASSGPDVVGHGSAELAPDKAALIERFLAGRCNDEERRELASFLLQNPERIRWIAEQIKSTREAEQKTA